MNNQKVTKLNARDQEIATLKKEKNFLTKHLKSVKDDLEFTQNNSVKNYQNFIEVNTELTKIKSNWLYKLITYFKK